MLAIQVSPLSNCTNISKRRTSDGIPHEQHEQTSPKKPKTPEKSAAAPSSTTLTPIIKAVALTSPRAQAGTTHRRKLFSEMLHPLCISQSGLVEKVDACKAVIDALQKNSVEQSRRITLAPQRISMTCATGSYFCRDMNGKVELVVKVGQQETGGAHCPSLKNQGNDGIRPGESLVREVFAYLVQERLKVNFGIPATCLTTMKHRLFGDLKGLDQSIENLEKFGCKHSYAELYSLSEQCAGFDQFLQLTLNKQRVSIETELEQKLTNPLASDVIAFCQSQKIASMAQFSSSLKSRFAEIGDARPLIVRYWNFLTREDAAKAEFHKLYSAFKTPDTSEALLSAQSFEVHDTSFDLLTEAEARKIRSSEFSKFIIDVMLFNFDRPRTNVLVKKVEDSYKLILIDHGFVLPRPFTAEDFASIRCPIYGFYKFDQAAKPLHAEVCEKITQLDIETLLGELYDDLNVYETLFPGKVKSALPEECFTLLECNIKWLKKAVSHNLTLRQIADFHLVSDDEDEMADSPLITCLKQARVGTAHTVDPLLYDKALDGYVTQVLGNSK